MNDAGQAHCVALARFATETDADILSSYLARYLPRHDLHYDQDFAIGALMYLDSALGTDHAQRFLVPGGLWQQWLQACPRKQPIDPGAFQRMVGQFCTFAADADRDKAG